MTLAFGGVVPAEIEALLSDGRTTATLMVTPVVYDAASIADATAMQGLAAQLLSSGSVTSVTSSALPLAQPRRVNFQATAAGEKSFFRDQRTEGKIQLNPHPGSPAFNRTGASNRRDRRSAVQTFSVLRHCGNLRVDRICPAATDVDAPAARGGDVLTITLTLLIGL